MRSVLAEPVPAVVIPVAEKVYLSNIPVVNLIGCYQISRFHRAGVDEAKWIVLHNSASWSPCAEKRLDEL